MASITADEIAALFATRLPQGGYVSTKQAQWLFGVASREAIKTRGSHNARKAHGLFTKGDQTYDWQLTMASPNGHGFFSVRPLEAAASVQARLTHEAALRVWNQQVVDLMASGAQQEEVRAWLIAHPAPVEAA